MAVSYSGLTAAQPVAMWSTAEEDTGGKVEGEFAGRLGLGDRIDLPSCVGHAGRVRFGVAALQALPGAQVHNLRPALVQAC
jgi:hypothetical protein